jgi:uncharacterized protein (TIGR02145 family)
MKITYSILFLLFITTYSFSQKPCPGTPTIDYAGKTYHTVQIGSQCWLKENLDVGTRINGSLDQTNNSTIEKYCYDDESSNCEKYGGLYQWNEAMQYITTEGAQGICPKGWRIPTKEELSTLETSVNKHGNKLKSKGQGSRSGAGTNTSEFSALLSGYRYDGACYYLGDYTRFWSSSENDTTYAKNMNLDKVDSYIEQLTNSKADGYSVRCLKD